MTLFRAALVQAAKAVKVALSLEDFLTALDLGEHHAQFVSQGIKRVSDLRLISRASRTWRQKVFERRKLLRVIKDDVVPVCL